MSWAGVQQIPAKMNRALLRFLEFWGFGGLVCSLRIIPGPLSLGATQL